MAAQKEFGASMAAPAQTAVDPDEQLVNEAKESKALIFIGINSRRTVIRYKNKHYITNRRMRAMEIRELLDEWIRTELFDFELRAHAN